jgi:hypothetical protein
MSVRRHVTVVLLVGAALGLGWGSGLAATLVIDFDTDPLGNPVEDGTVVDGLYSGAGVTFSHEGDTTCGTNVYASADRPAGFGSPPNVVSTCRPPFASDINSDSLGVIHAVLSQPASRVCIDVLPNGPGHFASLRVFDAGGAEIGSAQSALGVTQTLCADAVGIRGARFAGGSHTAFARFDNFAATFSDTTVCAPAASPVPTSLVASVLPSSRSIQVGTTATAFASIINTGSAPACGVGISLPSGIVASFKYNETVCSSNVIKGADDTPVNIAPGEVACFVISIGADGPFDPSELGFNFSGSNAAPVDGLDGINTLLMSASDDPVPDMVALAATVQNDGIVHVPVSGTGVFAVATSNLGVGATIVASANTGETSLPVSVVLCQTNPVTSACISAIGPSVTTLVAPGATPTFGIFVTATGPVPLDPAANRIFVVFTDQTEAIRGRTSVAVATQ